MPSHAPDSPQEDDGDAQRRIAPPADVPLTPLDASANEIGYESAHPALTGLLPGDRQGAASVWC